MTPRSRLAPAKINLTLHVTGQREDGYHLLDSLVVFAAFGDRVSLDPVRPLALSITGPQAAGLAAEADNLILRAARLLGASRGQFTLEKALPVASGMGGGSSDAAAALHLLTEASGQDIPGAAQLMALGADLPVCLAAPAPQRMRGLGEQVEPVARVPALWMLLVNPGQGLSTPGVFKALTSRRNPPMPSTLPRWADAAALCDWLQTQRNDLEAPASRIVQQITHVLALVRSQPGCLLARMTGSGATCFGVFADEYSLSQAAVTLTRPGWFVQATRTAGSVS
tara:strand:- start:2276 stop:3121 length:846 start_codon:yes stop_codon:yes gene_type:complete